VVSVIDSFEKCSPDDDRPPIVMLRNEASLRQGVDLSGRPYPESERDPSFLRMTMVG